MNIGFSNIDVGDLGDFTTLAMCPKLWSQHFQGMADSSVFAPTGAVLSNKQLWINPDDVLFTTLFNCCFFVFMLQNRNHILFSSKFSLQRICFIVIWWYHCDFKHLERNFAKWHLGPILFQNKLQVPICQRVRQQTHLHRSDWSIQSQLNYLLSKECNFAKLHPEVSFYNKRNYRFPGSGTQLVQQHKNHSSRWSFWFFFVEKDNLSLQLK